MKVLNLRCAADHGFEGWFASEDDFAAQAGRRRRRLSALRQHRDHPPAERAAPERRPPRRPRGASPPRPVQMTLQSQWLKVVRQVMNSTEDVGDRFAEEARRIHYGEVEERGIRGRASSEDAEALREEGIAVVALPLPDALKGPIQ